MPKSMWLLSAGVFAISVPAYAQDATPEAAAPLKRGERAASQGQPTQVAPLQAESVAPLQAVPVVRAVGSRASTADRLTTTERRFPPPTVATPAPA